MSYTKKEFYRGPFYFHEGQPMRSDEERAGNACTSRMKYRMGMRWAARISLKHPTLSWDVCQDLAAAATVVLPRMVRDGWEHPLISELNGILPNVGDQTAALSEQASAFFWSEIHNLDKLKDETDTTQRMQIMAAAGLGYGRMIETLSNAMSGTTAASLFYERLAELFVEDAFLLLQAGMFEHDWSEGELPDWLGQDFDCWDVEQRDKLIRTIHNGFLYSASEHEITQRCRLLVSMPLEPGGCPFRANVL